MRPKIYWGLFILSVILLGLPAFGAAQEKAPAETPQAVAPAPPAEKAVAPEPAEIPTGRRPGAPRRANGGPGARQGAGTDPRPEASVGTDVRFSEESTTVLL